MLHVKHLTKFFGAEIVLNNVSFVLNDNEHVGLIGPNGSGKTTLLRCIAGLTRPDSGEIVRSPSEMSVGYLPQVLDQIADLTVRDVIAQALSEWQHAEEEVQRLVSLVAEHPSDTEPLERYDAALGRFESLGGYERELRAVAIMDGLGLSESRFSQLVESLSGGEQTRLGLAKLLLQEPDLLLLDEPTNHLDIDALTWLEGFVSSFRGSILVVSHDREFLDKTINRILYLDPREQQVKSYPGNYSDFASAREHEAEIHEATWVQQEKYVHQVTSDVARLKGRALDIELSTTPRQPGVRRLARKKAALAKSRERKLTRFLASEDRVEKPQHDWSLNLDFGEPPPSGRSVLHVDEVSFRYPDKPILFGGVDIELQYGDRLSVVGPNGSGKTSLMKLITGTLEPVSGVVKIGTGVRLGLLAQQQETLDLSITVLETALRDHPMTQTEARSFLHNFLFSGDDVFRTVGQCSPGERSRLQLALLMLRGCNLLILDEPLNHLDIEGREQFQRSLEAFNGTIIAVVHDRAFLRTFDAPILRLANGVAHTYADYETFRARTTLS